MDQIPCGNFPLWYLPLYFVTAIIFDLLVRNKKVEKFLPIFVVLFIAITVPFQNLIPGRPALHINVLPAGLAFMGLGYLFNKYIKKQNLPDLVAYVCLVIGILISQVNGGNISEINSAIYYVGAICSIYFFYSITKGNNNKILAYIGKNSLIIYGIHSLIFSTLWIFLPIVQKIGKQAHEIQIVEANILGNLCLGAKVDLVGGGLRQPVPVRAVLQEREMLLNQLAGLLEEMMVAIPGE